MKRHARKTPRHQRKHDAKQKREFIRKLNNSQALWVAKYSKSKVHAASRSNFIKEMLEFLACFGILLLCFPLIWNFLRNNWPDKFMKLTRIRFCCQQENAPVHVELEVLSYKMDYETNTLELNFHGDQPYSDLHRRFYRNVTKLRKI